MLDCKVEKEALKVTLTMDRVHARNLAIVLGIFMAQQPEDPGDLMVQLCSTTESIRKLIEDDIKDCNAGDLVVDDEPKENAR